MDSSLWPRQPIYEPLSAADSSIRLLKLHRGKHETPSFRLHVVSLHDNPKPEYLALSYAWGPVENAQSIHLNDQEVQVRRNLFDFLAQFQGKPEFCGRYIWIDQLCIDQASNKEKAEQVSIMADIYRSATMTLVWLGEDQESGRAIRTIEKVCPYERSWNIVAEEDRSAVWNSKIIVSKSVIGFYGSGEISMDTLISLEIWGATNKLISLAYLFSAFRDLSPCGFCDNTWRGCTGFARDSCCERPIDKVYGMQNLFVQELRIKVDYTASTQEVFLAALGAWYMHWPSDTTFDLRSFFHGCLELAVGMGLRAEPQDHDEDERQLILAVWNKVGVDHPGRQWMFDDRYKFDYHWTELEVYVTEHILKSHHPAPANSGALMQAGAVEASPCARTRM